VAGVALIVGAASLFRGGGRHSAALVAAPPQPAPPPPDLAARFKKVEGMLEDGDLIPARRVLEQALSERPKDGRVRYLLGRVAYADERQQEALSHYREAITLDAGFRGDPVLLSHLDAMLADPKEADPALDLIVERIGAPAADLLEKVANDSNDLLRRRRAVASLDDIGQGKRVDRVSLAMFELKKASSCDERKVLVDKLREMGDAKALPALRALRGRRVGPISWGAQDTSCMKTELPEAIKALEKKAGIVSEKAERRPRRGR
jgi:tetratricopeptide (TPR) repeat protein